MPRDIIVQSESMENTLEINVLCDRRNSDAVSCTDIVLKKASLDPEDYNPEDFWGLTGGFQVTVQGYKTIFNNTDFHYLIKVTSFLIHSLYWIKDETCDWFDKDDFFPDDVVIRTTEDHLIKLHKLNNSVLIFSFTPALEGYISKRGDRFFEDFQINKQDWFSETDIALKEFFDILVRIANQDKTNRTSRLMMDYHQLWKKVSAI